MKIKKNLYGSKQAGRVWYIHLREGLLCRGFVKSKIDECIFYKRNTIFIVYVDDAIVIGPKESEIDNAIESLSKD